MTLPLPLTTFIGRRREIAEAQRLLESTRLLTLTGAGGAGKTRLALSVATTLVEAYADGIWLVSLEAITDAGLVPRHLATALGLREEAGQRVVDTLTSYLRARQALIVLDNCEHLSLPCAALAETLLQFCPGVRILATSRQPLGIAGETTWRVPSMAVPNPARRPPIERLRQVESVQLFVERAAAALPGFTLSEHNAAAVADVCQRLDGIPLALELAAARVRVLAVEQIAARLDDCFRLLTGGSPTVLPRHQTLLGTLDWSHDTLGDPAQRLLRRLSVFAGGFTLDAAEAVCSGDDMAASDVLDVLAELVDKSLVSPTLEVAGVARYRLLETVRQYASEKLRVANEETVFRRQHASWILSLTERVGPSTNGPRQSAALWSLMPELDNLRTALDWAVHDPPTVDAGLRACVGAYRLWLVHGFLGEGSLRLAEFAQAAAGSSMSPQRAYAFFAAGTLAMFQGDFARARSLVEDSLALARASGNDFQVSDSLSVLALLMLNQGEAAQAWTVIQQDLALCRRRIEEPTEDDGQYGNEFARSMHGVDWPASSLGRVLLIAGVGARLRGNYARAIDFYEESLSLMRQAGDTWFIAQVLSNLGLVSLDQHDGRRARELFDEALVLRRALGDRTGIARSLNDLGGVAYAEGDLDGAQACYGEHLAIVRELGDRSGIADALVALGQVARRRDELRAARAFFAESLTIRRELGHRLTLPTVLYDLAELAAAEGDPLRAIRLAAAAAALRESVGATAAQPDPGGLGAAIGQVDEAARAAAWQEGQAMSEDQALAYALTAPPPRAAQRAGRPSGPPVGQAAPLSARERSVARLIAFGRTNKQIAAELVIAEGTADRHVSNILNKLSLSSRAQVARWAADRGLVSPTPPD